MRRINFNIVNDNSERILNNEIPPPPSLPNVLITANEIYLYC